MHYNTMTIKVSTKCEKYTFLDAFFVLIWLFCFTSQSKKPSFSLLAEPYDLSWPREKCALAWDEAFFRSRPFTAFPPHSRRGCLQPTNLHMGLYTRSWKLHLIIFVLNHLNWSQKMIIMNKKTKTTTFKGNYTAAFKSLMSRKVSAHGCGGPCFSHHSHIEACVTSKVYWQQEEIVKQRLQGPESCSGSHKAGFQDYQVSKASTTASGQASQEPADDVYSLELFSQATLWSYQYMTQNKILLLYLRLLRIYLCGKANQIHYCPQNLLDAPQRLSLRKWLFRGIEWAGLW